MTASIFIGEDLRAIGAFHSRCMKVATLERMSAQMGKTVFQGAGVALVTPMYPDLRINYSMLDQMIDRQLTGHTDAIVVVGTSGEGSTLTDEEHCEVVEHTVRRVNHRIPVIAGVGSNNTSHAVELSKGAARAGADALLHVTPYYNKASQRGLVQHFNACANATDLPVILQYSIAYRRQYPARNVFGAL